MDLGLDGRAVVCTGATGGIGAPTAALLAAEGARLLLVDRDADRLEALRETLPGDGHAVLAADLREPASGDRIADAALDALGRLDALAHVAGVMVPVAFDDVDAELWDLHQEVNVRASFLLSRAVAARMPGEGGRIALVSSGAWLSGGMADRLPYAVSKGGVTTLVRSLARALGPRGVTVNGVAPGLVETPMMDSGLTPEQRTAMEAQTPLGRFARPEEIAPVIAFLLSSGASFVSGSTVVASGGLVLH